MSTAQELRIGFRDLSRQLVPGAEGIELRITADVRVLWGGEEIFTDDAFPVVEFAAASQDWVAAEPKLGLECEGLRVGAGAGGWEFAGEPVPLEAITDGLDVFYAELRGAIQAEYGFDLSAVLGHTPRTPKRDLQ